MRKFLFCTLCICLLAGICHIWAQNNTVRREWGRILGTAHTDRDFLIYDATCSQGENPAIYIVGKAEEGAGFELKRGENTYFHGESEYTDAFLACMSLEGELLWSTYLPFLENRYYNAFATAIEYTSDNTLIVTGNIYRVRSSISDLRNQIPNGEGKSFILELDTNGRLLKKKTFITKRRTFSEVAITPPFIAKIVDKTYVTTGNHVFSGIGWANYWDEDRHTKYIHSYPLQYELTDWREEDEYYVVSFHGPDWDYLQCISSYMCTPNRWNIISKYQDKATQDSHELLHIGYIGDGKNIHKKNDTTYRMGLWARGIDLIELSGIREHWNITSSSPDSSQSQTQNLTTQHHAYPMGTYNQTGLAIYPGTVQNIHAYNGKYLVQGIHCRNYDNGFFKKDGEPYAYSHDSTHLLPKPSHGFYQARKKELTAVPYLSLYDSATFFGTIATNDNGENGIYDFQPPLWGSYLNAEWLYEDMFHLADSAQWKDIYQPYAPILCSYGDRFFLIGNAKQIGLDLVDNPPMTEEIYHHQGVILAFSENCPPERTAFEDVRFLCPGDSVELRMPEEYTGFKFRFDPSVADNASVLLNADSSHAWVKQEGIYRAVLDGSNIGCPDAVVDSVRISLSPYPEPVSALPEDTTVSCAAFRPLFQAVAQHDSSFSYRWYDGDTLWQKPCGFIGDSLQPVSVTVNGYCTSFTDTAFIRFLPPYVDLGNDTLRCISGQPADTAVLLSLDANQDYFPAADWIFRWLVNGLDAGHGDSLLLRFSDLDSVAPDRYQALASVFVSLSDTATDGCTASDTISLDLFVLPDTEGNVFLPRDSILCAHLDLELQLPDESGNFHCFWLDRDSIPLPFGQDTNRFTIQGLRGTDGFGAGTDSRNPRFFQLKLEHRRCPAAFLDTLLVYDQVRPAFDLPFHDTVVCLNEPVVLDSLNQLVYRPLYGFEWNDGTVGSGYSFADSGTYILRFFVRDDFAVCGYEAASDTLRVLWADPAMTLITIPEDTSFCERLSVTLDASVPFHSTRYSWQEGNLDDLVPPSEDSTLFTSPVLKVDRETSYGLFLLDTLGCLNTRQINIHEEDCKPKLEIPNVFTPNGDGVNDVWRFTQLERCYQVDIIVVDRKGSHVLHEKVADAEDFAWNGCLRNGSRKMPDGPYFYMVSYRDAYGKKKYQSGSVTILGSAE